MADKNEREKSGQSLLGVVDVADAADAAVEAWVAGWEDRILSVALIPYSMGMWKT